MYLPWLQRTTEHVKPARDVVSESDSEGVDLERTEAMIHDLLCHNQRLSERLTDMQSAYSILLQSHADPQCGAAKHRERSECALNDRGDVVVSEM
jgi:uncharacterized protein